MIQMERRTQVDVDEALQIVASRILRYGPYREGSGCLIPSGILKDPQDEHNLASDVLYNNYHATHFSLDWKDIKQGLVTITLLQCENFGASLDKGKEVLTKDINL